jgi:ADP-heptose:LPS heptosyltransferase
VSFDDSRVTRLFVEGSLGADDPFLGIDAAVAWCADSDGALTRELRARGAAMVVVATARPRPGQTVHIARSLIESLRPLGVVAASHSEPPTIRVSTGGERQAREELSALGLEGRPFVAIHPGSGSAAKNWPAERFGALADVLRSRFGLPSLILGGPADEEALTRLRAATSDPCPLLFDRPLQVVAAVVRRARAFLGNDSGLSHLAGLLGVRTLALFGPTDPALWSPLGPCVRVLRSVPLAALQTDRVLAELAALIDGSD